MKKIRVLHSPFRFTIALAFLSLAFLNNVPVIAQHAHIFAGAARQVHLEPLFFVNGNLWDTNSYGGYTESPACIYFADNIPDRYPGLYQSATTFSSLPATIFNAGPSLNAASLGSFLEAQFVSLKGPEGGSLSVWSEIDDPANPSLLFSLPVGTGDGTNRINLSEGDASDPESDPYGHIHGRRFALDNPGLNVLGLQLIDTSTNGPDGGPIHSASSVTYFYLQAGLFVSDFSMTNKVAIARFGLQGSKDYVVEASSFLPATNWVTITNILGASHSELRWFKDPDAVAPMRFYRIREGTN
jgi:hypothetical protein